MVCVKEQRQALGEETHALNTCYHSGRRSCSSARRPVRCPYSITDGKFRGLTGSRLDALWGYVIIHVPVIPPANTISGSVLQKSTNSMAGDAFFSKTRKRKRPNGRPTSELPAQKRSKSIRSRDTINPKNRRRKDDELDSAGSDDDVGGNIDDLDLKESDVDEKAEGDENENETAAEKRLRLAKLYLDSVREDIGTKFYMYVWFKIVNILGNILGNGEVDAAEIDRELIASRLRQDVVRIFHSSSPSGSDKYSPLSYSNLER